MQEKDVFENQIKLKCKEGENCMKNEKFSSYNNSMFAVSKKTYFLFFQILFSILIQYCLCNFDYSKHLMKIDEKKFKKAMKKYDYLFLFVDYPHCLQCKQLEPELGAMAFTSRLENLKVRYFQINFPENENFLRNLLDIRTLPQLYFFDNKLNYKFPLNLDLDFGYLPRLFKKLSGKFNITNMESSEQLNDIHFAKKNMILLFNKEKLEAFELFGKEIRNLIRLSVVAGYDTFYYCDKNVFFENFVKSKNPELEFTDKSFYFLTGPIKNVTMKQILEKDTNILFDENVAKSEEDDLQTKNQRKKDSEQAEDEEKEEINNLKSENKSVVEETNSNSNSTENKNDFSKAYNFFKIDVDKLKEFDNEQTKQDFLLEYFIHFKYNTYSSLGHNELADVIEMGKPTFIIFGPQNFINDQKNFHREMYNLSKKYERKIKFYYSTLDSPYAKYFSRILNLRHSELPVFLIIEKNNKEKNDFNKFKLTNAEFTQEAVEKFINDYYAKNLKFYFVSQSQLDVTEENLKDALATLNGTSTDAELNKKYYNAGRNIYQIEGRHFESFMKDTLNRTVVIMACSFPMINCRNGLEKLRFVTQTFNKFMDKVIFAETDPNFNEYTISVKDNNSDENLKENNNFVSKTYKFEDYYKYIFKPLYPQLVIFPAVSQKEIEELSDDLNSLIIKKLKNSIEFTDDFDCLMLLKFVGRYAKIPSQEVEIDHKYLQEEDVNGNIKFTADYDEDFLSEEEIEKDKDLDSRIEELKELLGPDAAELFEILNAKNLKESKEIKKEIVEAVDKMKNKQTNDSQEQIVENSDTDYNLKQKDDL